MDELKEIKELAKINDDLVSCSELINIQYKKKNYPVIGFKIGSDNPGAPCLGLFGGVHGLEKVGTHVVISYLASLFKQLSWDQELRESLKHYRIVSIPLINPVGMAHHRRSNGNGVDLMRNAPVNHEGKTTFLVSGHRISNKLPWYQGDENSEMELETRATESFVQKYMYPSKSAISLDFHSGFGMRDRLWFPYAKSNEKFPRINEVNKLTALLNETFPHHIYKVEPQSTNYTINGDLWDYLYDKHHLDEKYAGNTFIPWTMEMGSWNWVKKNPTQILFPLGLFNPIKDHRYGRTMRRHLLLIDFFSRAVRNLQAWTDYPL